MLARYGEANGFGWQLNETIGAQIVTVPMDVAIERANKTFRLFLILLGGLFVFLFLALYVQLSDAGRATCAPAGRDRRPREPG